MFGTFLLTGGRRAEVLGLAVDDVSFDRRTVTFRPHPWRRLKTATSFRVVPLWPQLEEILRLYVFGVDRAPGRLLFPSVGMREKRSLVDIRKLLDRVGARVGYRAGEIRTRIFRHTYAGARLQTLDQGTPVGILTVARELGHGGDTLVRKVYGHLGQVRHRSDVVEYPVTLCEGHLSEKLAVLR